MHGKWVALDQPIELIAEAKLGPPHLLRVLKALGAGTYMLEGYSTDYPELGELTGIVRLVPNQHDELLIRCDQQQLPNGQEVSLALLRGICITHRQEDDVDFLDGGRRFPFGGGQDIVVRPISRGVAFLGLRPSEASPPNEEDDTLLNDEPPKQ